jgi:acid phosphatase
VFVKALDDDMIATKLGSTAFALLCGATLFSGAGTLSAAELHKLTDIKNVVVIFAENRSFDNLYGQFPGANGLKNASAGNIRQLDRNGEPLPELPPIWGGLTPKGAEPVITQEQTQHLPNGPFAIDGADRFNLPLGVPTRDLSHRFYQNQMQINGGKNDKFAAWGDSGALVMGTYDGSKLPMWPIAHKYVLADNFFMASFGGSFLNHFALACACVGQYPDVAISPARDRIAMVEADSITLKASTGSPASALEGKPDFENDGAITPDGFAVNTMQPPYQPSSVPPPVGGDPALTNLEAPTRLPAQTLTHIGDLLSAKNVSWAWYAGAWDTALVEGSGIHKFQYHHQPFNYFASLAPGTPARAEHLKDGGVNGDKFFQTVDNGTLPQVSFYKPQGDLNEHPGYADILSGDQHIANIIAHLEKSPQWPGMLVVVAYDENGGFWDHVAPPKGDRWGPGTRVPAIIISPFAKMATVDHTQYDTTSILRFLTRRFELPVLGGLAERDAALKIHNEPPMGDLTAALNIAP